MKFTHKQIANWRKYEKIRESGKFNMWDDAAMRATGLNRDDYIFTLRNYNDLKEQTEKA